MEEEFGQRKHLNKDVELRLIMVSLEKPLGLAGIGWGEAGERGRDWSRKALCAWLGSLGFIHSPPVLKGQDMLAEMGGAGVPIGSHHHIEHPG